MGKIEIEEKFKQLDFIKINNKPLTYLQDDGGYMTQILFNKMLMILILDIINEQTQELKWRKE